MRFFGKLRASKRGVGSIIGATFLVLILMSGFAFYEVILNATDHYNSTVDTMSEADWNRGQERIVIKQIGVTDANRLNITAENDGSIQSHLIWLGICNTTANPQNQTYQALNDYIKPGDTDSVVSSSTVTQGNKYLVQIVTELGNTVESSFYPANYASCALTLVTIPPTVYQGNNITVLLTVTPNDTSVDSIQSLTANVSATPASLLQLMSNSSLSVTGLMRGTSAFFWWIYNTTGIGTVTFNATYTQAPVGTYVLSSAAVLSSSQQIDQGKVVIAGNGGTAQQNPSTWNLLGSTQYVGGSAADLVSNDSSYAVFRSYFNAAVTDINHSVDNNSSNVDNSTNYGTHNSFTALQNGPDSVMDNLTESATDPANPETWVLPTSYEGSGWTNPSLAYDNNTSTGASISINAGTYSSYLTLNFSAVSCHKIQYYIGQSGSQMDNVQIDVYNGTWTNVYSGSGTWSTWTNVSFTETSATKIRFQFHNSHPSQQRTAYVYEAQFLQSQTLQTYGLDLEVQWTNVEYTQTNRWLCIYGGTMATESLLVDAWNGTAWNNLFAYLSTGWNNISVSSYITSSNFTIRFKDDNPSDTSKDSWTMDVALLHLWTIAADQYTAEVEFTGSSNLENWTTLMQFADSSWDTASVSVTIQFYNYTLGAYPSSGNGCYSHTSSLTPNTDESISQTIIAGATQFRNSTGYWKMKIKGVKLTSTQFLMKIDWIEIQDTYTSAGNSIPYNAWQSYTVSATAENSGSVPFAYISIYANGTCVALRNATDSLSIPNPSWLRLDSNGAFQLQLKSTNSSGETFILFVVFGSIAQQKTITQGTQ